MDTSEETVARHMTRDFILEIGKSSRYPINRLVRKKLISYKLWCPKLYQTLPLRPHDRRTNNLANTKIGLINAWSVNGKENIISEVICDNELDLFVISETWWPRQDERYSLGKKIRKYLDKPTTEIMVNCLIMSKLDYNNALLSGVNDYLIARI